MISARIALFLLLTAVTQTRAQQPLTLREALERAARASYSNRIASGSAAAQNAQEFSALRGILPTVRLESGYARTTDPIGAFGTTLRQREVDQSAFDPRRLNYPPAATNFSGSIVIEAPLLNADAHAGRLAARKAGEAADASAAWTGTTTEVQVIRAYYGAVLAAEKTVTLSAALKAAQAHVRQAEQLVTAGLVTRADALMASVKAGEIETQLIEARGEARLGLEGLTVVLGESGDFSPQLPQVLPGTSNVRALLATSAISAGRDVRQDVAAAALAKRAAELDVQRSLALYLPRLNAVARYDWNSESGPYSGDRNWTVGVLATWTPFAGASEIGERRAANARASMAEAQLEAARAQANLDLSKAAVDREVALKRLEIAERGAQQSKEAHRIVARKYENGLATVVELLEAAASETQSQLALAHARYAGIIAAAESLRAQGGAPALIAHQLNNDPIGDRE